MPCYSPLTGYQSRSLTDNGKRKIVFNRSHGFADKPMQVPCGQCIGCRIDRSRMWAIRCVHESRMHDSSCFITLTYDLEHLPADLGLHKIHLQNFFKRVRNAGHIFRYFACGEYGDQSKRPHYHAILFGINFASDRKKHSITKQDHILYTSKTLSDLWGKGHALLSEFSYQTAAYTARYVMKKQNGANAGQHENYTRLTPDGELIQVQPEFALMSRNPGLGSSWFAKYQKDAFPSDYLVHQGKKHPVPRFYLDKLQVQDEKACNKIKQKRKLARKNDPDSTPQRLNDREICKLSKIKQLQRTL